MRLEFDLNNNVEIPEIVLGKRNYDKFGSIVNFDKLSYDYNLMSADSISLTIYKELNHKKERLWDEIKDRRLIWLKEFNEWFQIDVTVDDENGITKTITGTSLCEAELGQVLLKSTEINTENDIKREEYINPTVFYKPSNPNESLLHRLLKEVPNYSIKYVDESLWNIQRTFSIDGTSIYDELTGEIAEEIGCLFLFDSTDRSISVYDLKTNCNHCGHRAEYTDICPECGSTDLNYGYGNDTTIFVDSETLAENISLSGKQDEVKNYIKVCGGDDVIDAAIAACNPTGTQYIYAFSDRDREDMSESLVSKLNEYSNEYESLTPTYQAIMKEVYDAIDEQLKLESTMIPDIKTAETNAQKELAKLTPAKLSPIAVQDVSIASVYTVNNAVLGMAKCIVNSTVFKIEIIDNSATYSGQVWRGKFKITNRSDENDVAENTGHIEIVINDDYAYYVEQKIKKIIDRDDVHLVDMFDKKTTLNTFKSELKKYCLSRLNSFESAYQSIIDVLIETNCANDSTYGDIYNDLYLPYYNKLTAIQEEIGVRASEIETVDAKLSELEKSRTEITNRLNLKNYLGDELWKELCSFRREDTYENSNYISDGLDNSKIIAKAQELFNKAKKEAITASTLQMSLSTTMFNLLAIPEFKKITGMFEGGNWIRVGLDDKIYRLRLVHYKIDFSQIQNIEVEFSDVTQTANGLNDTKSLIDKVNSMATNFSYVAHQAEQGSKSFAELDKIRNDGLNTALYNISNSTNQDFIIDEHGITGRKWDDILGDYSPEQVKMNNNILVYTNDYWQTAKSALGKIEYYNPILKTTVSQYGLIADAVISGILMGNDIVGGDIYSENYSFTSGTHIDLNTGDFTFAGGKLVYDSKKDTLNLTGTITFEGIDYSSHEAKKALQNSLGITDVQNDIDEFNNASILTPLEKKNMLDNWTSIQSEYQKNIELAKAFDVSNNSIVIAYTNAYNTLANQISKCGLDNLTTPTTIDARIYNDINNYYAANVDFANLINKEAKRLSEQALIDAKAYSNEEISKLSTSVNKEISELNTELTDTQTYLDGAFKDGIVDEIELSKINQLIKQIELEKLDVDKQYTSIYNNSFLNTDTKASIKNTYDNYDNAHASLINSINSAITTLNSTSDQSQKLSAIENVNSSFDTYKEKITKIHEALNYAIDEISTLKVSDLRYSVNKDIEEVNTLIDNTQTYIDGAFHDKVIDESEAASISQLLYRLDTEKVDLDARYNSIYNNLSISAASKNNLKSAKENYDNSHTSLKTLINTAVSVVQDTTKTDNQKQTAINNMNKGFTDYNSKISALSTAFESAIDSIGTNKLDAFVNGDYKNFVSDIQTQVDGKSETYYTPMQPYENHLNIPKNSNYDKLVGDLWYDSDESVKKTYIYTRTTNGNNYDYKWMEMEVPAEVFDMADGKAQIFTSKPSNYNKNDLWLIGSDYIPSTVSGAKLGYVLVSKNTNSGYTESDWVLSIKYTDDTVANNALTVATQAVSDSVLTPSEKRDLLNEINSIKASYSKYTAICSMMNIAYTGYTTAYNNLINNMTGSSSVYKLDSFVNTTLTSSQVTNFKNYFSDYYTAEANIIKNIQSATNTNVNNAQNTADKAQGDATEALGLLNDIASDNKITPVEKLQLKEKYSEITSSYNKLLEKYPIEDYYGKVIEFTNLKATYDVLAGLFDVILNDMNETYDFTSGEYTREMFLGRIKDYYSAYQSFVNYIDTELENSISDVKSIANEAQSLGSELKKCLGFSTEISSDYVISPYIGGGYLNMTGTSGKVIIDPQKLSNDTYIFGVYNSNDELVMGVDVSGNGIFNGTITANQIATNAITSIKIADGAITSDKMLIGNGGNLYTFGYDTFEHITKTNICYRKTAVDPCIDTSTSYYGSRCLRLDSLGSDGYVCLGHSSNGYGCIPVVTGKTYIISAYMKSSSSSDAQLWVVGHKAKDSINYYPASTSATIGTSWTRVYMRYTATSSYPYISLRIDNDTSGTSLYVDAIQIETGTKTQMPSTFVPAGVGDIDGSRIYIDSITSDKISVEDLNAFNAKIGGFVIDSNSIYYDQSNNEDYGVDGSVMMCRGSVSSKSIGSSSSINGWCFTAGSKFGVTKNGDLYASSATISGKITSSEGTIGGWSLSSSAIYRNYSTYGTSGGMYFGTSGLSIGSNFKVSSGGTVTANGTFATGTSETYAELSDGKLSFYRNNTTYSSFGTGYWSGTSTYGTCMYSEVNSKFMSFGNKSSSSDTTYMTNFLINYGLNPNGRTEDVITFGKFLSTDYILTDSLYMLNKPGVITLTSGRVSAWNGTCWGINNSETGTGLYVFGNIGCSGTKERIIQTKNYGAVELNAYETATPFFGDIGSGECDENGLCYIYLDEIFKETIITEFKYYIFLQQYGNSNVSIIEKNQDYFVIKGSPYQKFDFEIKCRQLGTENMRLNRAADIIESEV